MPTKKVFVVITGRDATSPGIYQSWESASPHIQGVKKSSGVKVLYRSFEGPNRQEDAEDYWREHQLPPREDSYPRRGDRVSSRASTRCKTVPTSVPRQSRRTARPASDRSRSNSHDDRHESTRNRERSPRGRSHTSHRSREPSRTRRSSSPREHSRPRNPSQESSSVQSHPARHFTDDRRSFNSDHDSWNQDYDAPRSSRDENFVPNSSASDRHHLETHWTEGYLQQRLLEIQHARHQLPTTPTVLLATLATSCDDTFATSPADIVDRQYKLTLETYRRILYTDSWSTKDKYFHQYIQTVDDQRDKNLQSICTVHTKVVKNHNILQRKNKVGATELVASQSIQTSLFQQNQRLNLANKALKQLNLRYSNNAKKAVHFDNAEQAKEKTDTDSTSTNAIPDSPLKKTKRGATSAKSASYKSPTARKRVSAETPIKVLRSSSVKGLRSKVTENTPFTPTTPDTESVDDSDLEIVTTIKGTQEHSDDDREEFEDDFANAFADIDETATDGEEFGFELPDCKDCVEGSGRKEGHSGRHTRTIVKPTLSI